MNRKTLFCLLFFVTASLSAISQESSDALARLGMMRVVFKGFEEVPNPETKRPEFAFYLTFIDLRIPKQPLLLRRGDRVASYLIGAFIKREPQQRPNDGVVRGTVSTLEIIHEESGEKYILEEMRTHTVTRDR